MAGTIYRNCTFFLEYGTINYHRFIKDAEWLCLLTLQQIRTDDCNDDLVLSSLQSPVWHSWWVPMGYGLSIFNWDACADKVFVHFHPRKIFVSINTQSWDKCCYKLLYWTTCIYYFSFFTHKFDTNFHALWSCHRNYQAALLLHRRSKNYCCWVDGLENCIRY